MKVFLDKLSGPYFEFLILENDKYWQRSGNIRMKNRVTQEYFNHPDALRIQDSIIGLISDCFSKSHPGFNYYGATEFRNENLSELLNNISKWLDKNRFCETREKFLGLLTKYFIEELKIESLDDQWKTIRDELNLMVSVLYGKGELAKQTGKTLLVLGI